MNAAAHTRAKLHTGVALAAVAACAGCATTGAPVAGPTAPEAEFRHEVPPPLADAPRAPEPALRIVELDNGIPLWIALRPGVGTVDVRYVNLAAADPNPAFELGLATLSADVLIQGSTLPDGTLIREPRVAGRAVQAWTSPSHTSIGVELVREGVGPALAILAAVVRSPVIDAEAVRRALRRNVEDLRNKSLSVAAVTDPMLMRRIWGSDHPLAQQPRALEQALRSIDRERIAAFHAAAFRPEHSAIVVVGDVDAERVIAQAEHSFGDWAAASAEPRAATPLVPTQREALVIDAILGGWKEPLVDVVFASPALARSDYHAFGVALKALSGGLGSRAMLSLRHHEAQLYAIWTSHQTYPGAGTTRLQFRAPAEQTGTVLAKLLREIDRLRREPLTRDEFELARRSYRVELKASTNAELANQLAELFASGSSPSWLQAADEALDALRPEDVQAAARHYFSIEPAISIVGDYRKAMSGLEELGKIEEYTVELPKRGPR